MNTSLSMRNQSMVSPNDAGLPEVPESPTPVQNSGKESRSKLEVAGLGLKCCIQIGIMVAVLFIEIKDWPDERDVYDTDNPSETSRGGKLYTCGCSLPRSLGLDADLDLEGPTVKKSLNICYEKNSLDTVRILTYSNSAAAKIERLFADIEPDILESKKIYNLTVSGYKATQEAYDLYGAINRRPVVDPDLQPLFIGGDAQPATFRKLGEMLSTSSDFTGFPEFYVRLVFQYYCKSCHLCDPSKISKVWKGISEDEWWTSCFRWDEGQDEGNATAQTCQGNASYYGKCLVYPTETLPPSFAISRFLESFLRLPGINRSLDTWEANGRRLPNVTWLEPSTLYLNISQVQNSLIQLKFVEVIKNSVLWVSLLNYFPTLDNECALMDSLKVCNGTSVCNLFTNTNSYGLKCRDMDVRDQCKLLMTANGTGTSTVDNTARSNLWSRLNPSEWLDLECPEFKCNSVLPYLAMWNTSVEMEDDALNRFLSRKILDDSWAQLSSVCTKTYTDVHRIAHATPGADDNAAFAADDNGTMYLQTECTSSNKGTSPYCWLTGRYHNISDGPTDDWKNLNSLDVIDHRFLKPHDYKRFTCYRMKDERFRSWFISTFGLMFSWVGTVNIIGRWLAKGIQSIRKKGN